MAWNADNAGTVEFRHEQPQANALFLVGSFNGWNPHSHPMRRRADGQWTCSLELAAGSYQFYYLARLAADASSGNRGGPPGGWQSSDLDFLVVTPRGGSFHMTSAGMPADGAAEDEALADQSALDEGLLPLSRLESALIRGFRRLPDHESRAAFLDVLEESVYS